MSADDYEKLTTLAKQSYSAVSEAKKLQEENRYLTRQIWSLQSEVSRLKTALSELTEKCRPYLEALRAAPKAVKEFIGGILERFKSRKKAFFMSRFLHRKHSLNSVKNVLEIIKMKGRTHNGKENL